VAKRHKVFVANNWNRHLAHIGGLDAEPGLSE
jgi:hypothetical protein